MGCHSQCAIQPETCSYELFIKDLGCSTHLDVATHMLSLLQEERKKRREKERKDCEVSENEDYTQCNQLGFDYTLQIMTGICVGTIYHLCNHLSDYSCGQNM